MTRSIYLPGESGSDVESALAKANNDEERRHLISERLKSNGWTKEKELRFREHCKTCGFILGSHREKENPMAKDTERGTKARMLADAARASFRQSKIEQD